MRIWQEQQFPPPLRGSFRHKATFQEGSEIIFTPSLRHNTAIVQSCCSGDMPENPISFSKRFASFGSSSRPPVQAQAVDQNHINSTSIADVTIPIHNILTVEPLQDSYRIILAVKERGLFEVSLENRNGMEVLLAFLRARLSSDRIIDDNTSLANQSNMSQNSRSTKSFDVEAFTASRMAERIQHETFSERLRRKVGKFISSLEEGMLTDCVWYLSYLFIVMHMHTRISLDIGSFQRYDLQ
jgi:hypothetical protein